MYAVYVYCKGGGGKKVDVFKKKKNLHPNACGAEG